ncbi:MAG: nuclear transport factor 2 family protein [Bacteroidota bacterium]
MKKLMVLALFAGGMWSCSQPKPEEAAPVETKPQPVEFSDASYTDLCKQTLVSLTNKDPDAYVSNMADNAIYRFNNGDSIAGKPAITDYWNDRITNVIDEISFSDEVWLSLKVNETTQGIRPGNWVLGWYRVMATYTKGQSMTQNIHTIYHFDASGKIDEVIQYLDRAPIIAAMPKTK